MAEPNQPAPSSFPTDKFLRGDANFTEADVRELIRTGEDLAARAVLTLAERTLRAQEFKKCKVTANKITGSIPAASKCSKMEFEEFEGVDRHLKICLSIGPKTYSKIPIMPHDKYVPELQEAYEFMSKTAVIFWKHFREAIGPTVFFPPFMDSLKVDPNNPISMYFCADFPERVIICGMYCSSDGTIWVRQPTAAGQGGDGGPPPAANQPMATANQPTATGQPTADAHLAD